MVRRFLYARKTADNKEATKIKGALCQLLGYTYRSAPFFVVD
jgi:hypothetical protein